MSTVAIVIGGGILFLVLGLGSGRIPLSAHTLKLVLFIGVPALIFAAWVDSTQETAECEQQHSYAFCHKPVTPDYSECLNGAYVGCR